MLLPRVLQNVISVHHECVSLDDNGPHYGVDHLKTINKTSLIFLSSKRHCMQLTIQYRTKTHRLQRGHKLDVATMAKS